MAILFCKCGNPLSNGNVPNDIELHVYTDREWEDKINIGIINSVEIPRPKNAVWKCPKCERLNFWDENFERVIKIYSIESKIE